MKKLLSIIGAISIVGSGVSAVIACGYTTSTKTAEEILNEIKNKNISAGLASVYSLKISDSKTQTVILNQLKAANKSLTTDDLKSIKFLSTGNLSYINATTVKLEIKGTLKFNITVNLGYFKSLINNALGSQAHVKFVKTVNNRVYVGYFAAAVQPTKPITIVYSDDNFTTTPKPIVMPSGVKFTDDFNEGFHMYYLNKTYFISAQGISDDPGTEVNYVLSSKDGVIFKTAAKFNAEEAYYVNNTYVFTSANGAIYSTDGLTWKTINKLGVNPTALHGDNTSLVTFINGHWLINQGRSLSISKTATLSNNPDDYTIPAVFKDCWVYKIFKFGDTYYLGTETPVRGLYPTTNTATLYSTKDFKTFTPIPFDASKKPVEQPPIPFISELDHQLLITTAGDNPGLYRYAPTAKDKFVPIVMNSYQVPATDTVVYDILTHNGHWFVLTNNGLFMSAVTTSLETVNFELVDHFNSITKEPFGAQSMIDLVFTTNYVYAGTDLGIWKSAI